MEIWACRQVRKNQESRQVDLNVDVMSCQKGASSGSLAFLTPKSIIVQQLSETHIKGRYPSRDAIIYLNASYLDMRDGSDVRFF
jgi:hypothetical protein